MMNICERRKVYYTEGELVELCMILKGLLFEFEFE